MNLRAIRDRQKARQRPSARKAIEADLAAMKAEMAVMRRDIAMLLTRIYEGPRA